MPPLGVNVAEVGLVLIGSILGKFALSSKWGRLAFFALLGLGSLYVGFIGLNMLSPAMSKAPGFTTEIQHALSIAYCTAAVTSGLLLMPSARRLFVRITGMQLDTPQSILGVWLFAILFSANAAFIAQFSGYFITLFTNGQGHNDQLFTILVQQASYILIAVIGAGVFLHRNPLQVAQHLGLLGWRVTAKEEDKEEPSGMLDAYEQLFVVILFVGGSLLLAVTGFLLLKYMVAQAYTAMLFTLGVTLPHPGNPLSLLLMACLVGVVVGIGEEVLFRGLLQPAFGLLPTSLLFTALHCQFGFSPALGFVFLQSLGYGWLRQRYSTWIAVAAHILFTTLALILWWLAFR